MSLAPLKGVGQPVYEVIKREDMIGAFQAALSQANEAVLERINTFIDLYSSVAPQSLWTWGQTSRWDFDLWW